MKLRTIAVVGVALFAFTACDPQEGDFTNSAEDFINDDNGEVAVSLGLTFEDAECEDPTELEVGTEFVCTALGSDGQTYTFTNEVSGKDEFALIDASVGG